MANNQHIIVSPEVTWGTFVTPAHAFPMDSFSVDPGQEYIDGMQTGSGRALRNKWRGVKAPTGSFSLPFWGEKMGHFIKAAGLYHTEVTTPVGATNARLHGFLPADSTDPMSLSIQAKHTDSFVQNVRGAVPTRAAITVANKGLTTLAMDFIAQDEVRNDGTWVDGSAAPAIVSSPSYFAGTVEPFFAWQAAINIGGTPALDNVKNEITLTGATANALLETLEIAIESAASVQHLLNGRRDPGSVWAGGRKVTMTFDLDWSTPNDDFYDYLLAGTGIAVQVVLTGNIIEGAIPYKLAITIPKMKVISAPMPEISGSMDRPSQSVELEGIVDPTTNYDINITIVDTQTAAY